MQMQMMISKVKIEDISLGNSLGFVDFLTRVLCRR